MKLPKSILIEKACSGDASRPVLASVYLDKNSPADGLGRSRLLATNGRIAAIVPVLTDDTDAAGYITAVALKAARKASGKCEDAFLTANGVCKMPDGQEFARPDLGKYPNVDCVIPKDETKFSVCLDPELLYALAQAIGSERAVTLEISGEGKAIRVRPATNPRAENANGKVEGFRPACMDALGVIMPVMQPKS